MFFTSEYILAMFSGIAQIAYEKKIPLFVYGENGESEYGGSSAPEYNKLDTEGVIARVRSDRALFKEPHKWHEYGIPKEQLVAYQEPDEPEKVYRIFLADYIPWNNNQHVHYVLNVIGGFTLSDKRTVGTYTHGFGVDDSIDEIYLWLTWPKFGYGRSTKYAAKDIREGKLTRKRAIELVKFYDGEFPWYVFDLVLKTLDITENEFWNMVQRHIGDEDNIAREREEALKQGIPPERIPIKIPAWEKIGNNTWRHANPIHGEERILEIPLPRPDNLEPVTEVVY